MSHSYPHQPVKWDPWELWLVTFPSVLSLQIRLCVTCLAIPQHHVPFRDEGEGCGRVSWGEGSRCRDVVGENVWYCTYSSATLAYLNPIILMYSRTIQNLFYLKYLNSNSLLLFYSILYYNYYNSFFLQSCELYLGLSVVSWELESVVFHFIY